jgi:hypothetical protein
MDKRLRFMTDLIAPLRVAPWGEVRLSRDHDLHEAVPSRAGERRYDHRLSPDRGRR